ncbi:MAG: SDR family oxidoreductase [Planctomycetaceae bacterium]
MRDLNNRTVFLTGAASGIGRELAMQLAGQGCHLCLVDVDEAGLRRLATALESFGGRVWTKTCDLTDSGATHATVADALAHCDTIDILINNAGVAYYGPTEEMTQQQWDWLMAVNLLAPIRITQQLLPHLLQRPDAHLVNMCSISGIVAGGRFAAYHTSKFGLIGFTEAMRAEYGRRGLGVSAICPGPVRTRLYESAASSADRTVPHPPGWLCASPERVAMLTIKAIRKNRRQVLITPMAHGLFQLKRFAPGLIDFANQFSRSKRRRRQQRLQAEEARLRAIEQCRSTEVSHSNGSKAA